MPTILRFRNFRIVVFTEDHTPSHVHARGPGVEVIFYLACWNGPPRVRANRGVPNQVLKELTQFVAANLHLLCKAWEAIHGDPTRV